MGVWLHQDSPHTVTNTDFQIITFDLKFRLLILLVEYWTLYKIWRKVLDAMSCNLTTAVIKMDRTTFTRTNFQSNGHVKSYKISMVCLTLCRERDCIRGKWIVHSQTSNLCTWQQLCPFYNFRTLYFKTRFEMELFAEALILLYIYKI